MTEGLEQWQEFRRAREAELTQPRGWLTLTGFHWLPETPTELGGLPGRWSTDGEDAFLDAHPEFVLLTQREAVDGGHGLALYPHDSPRRVRLDARADAGFAFGNRHTAAGFPPKGRAVKAST